MSEPDYLSILKHTARATTRGNNPLVLLVGAAALLVGSAASLGILFGPLAVGLAKVASEVAEGRPATWEQLGHGFDRFVPSLIAGGLYLLAVTIGFALLVLPGIVAGIALGFAFFVLARDPNSTGFGALMRSARWVRANLAPTVVWAVVSLAIVGVTSLIPIIGTVAGAALTAVWTSAFLGDQRRLLLPAEVG